MPDELPVLVDAAVPDALLAPVPDELPVLVDAAVALPVAAADPDAVGVPVVGLDGAPVRLDAPVALGVALGVALLEEVAGAGTRSTALKSVPGAAGTRKAHTSPATS